MEENDTSRTEEAVIPPCALTHQLALRHDAGRDRQGKILVKEGDTVTPSDSEADNERLEPLWNATFKAVQPRRAHCPRYRDED
ncbi:hypothetical protein POSPLADRAFT_1047484 [Postia placenta MAD-698-R-SB12]|uniref:Uncharacterized protein n=1 Tax=Postia placenta MAD-698-R-SB12 TaxID=670580 RepID=A0A1X6MY03_9APHY|nr:hypothetical protein POSPLADRAFT_1047484 [Postia placenta MAD-698-R-SB12]OSX61248.1 hypothetical protein POSPLADRAFT_1047484 [Postia placenta MAD-698-R-SB12]